MMERFLGEVGYRTVETYALVSTRCITPVTVGYLYNRFMGEAGLRLGDVRGGKRETNGRRMRSGPFP